MSGLHEVDCGACGRRHVMSAARAREQRVLRCECGQFVRLDRALAEAHSDPDPARAPDGDLADAFDDEETHMFSSLDAIAALGSAPRNPVPQTSAYEEDDAAATRVLSAALGLRSLPPPPNRSSKAPGRSDPPAAEKPLWYVDLGGTETVEMTIEQLIIARRSGKLGEGALVWRAGMPRWRPIGLLIPAAGSGAPRQSLPPPPASAPGPLPLPGPLPAPSRPKQAAPPALGSYERPLATLEFAIEKSDVRGPREATAKVPPPAPRRPASGPPPAPKRASSRPPPRAPSPVPRPAPQSTPPASATAPASVPPRSGTRESEPPFMRPRSAAIVAARLAQLWRFQRPRWLSVSVAVLLCAVASGAGAFVVRTLKGHRQPLALSPATSSTSARLVTPLATPPSAPLAPPEPGSAPEVVDIDSLSVEHHTKRAWHPSAAPAVTAGAALNAIKNAENADSDEAPRAAPSTTASAPARKAKTDLPPVAHSNPYTTGSADGTGKKAAPSSTDDPGF